MEFRHRHRGPPTPGSGLKYQISASYDRNHDVTGTGVLTSTDARVSYVASWYDGVGRQIASANYGTNGGTAMTVDDRPDTAPSSTCKSRESGQAQTGPPTSRIASATCVGHPEPPQRSGSAGGKKLENWRFFLTYRQFESLDFACHLMVIACGGVPTSTGKGSSHLHEFSTL